ncbi:hypothetical protein HKX48_003041, partial [Thoreauomyces humboldtii]
MVTRTASDGTILLAPVPELESDAKAALEILLEREERFARKAALCNSETADGALSNDDNLCGDEVEDVEEADDSLSHKKDGYE